MVESIEWKESIEGLLWMSDYSFFRIYFENEYLNERFNVSISLPSKEEIDNDTISIVGLYHLTSDINIRMGMQYDHKTRTMIYEPLYINDTTASTYERYYDEDTITQYLTQYGITEEDIKEYQRYILYDVVYQSWISGTDNGRKLNKWDYWNIKEVDNTFNFEVVE